MTSSSLPPVHGKVAETDDEQPSSNIIVITTPPRAAAVTNDKNDDEDEQIMGAMIPIVTLNKVPLSPKKKKQSLSSKQKQQKILLVVFSTVVVIAAVTFASVAVLSSVRKQNENTFTGPSLGNGQNNDPKESKDDDNDPPIIVTTNNKKWGDITSQDDVVDDKNEDDVGQPCTQNTDCSSRVCVGNHCLAGLVNDEGLCDDHDDCESGSCAMFGAEMACCPDGVTFDMGTDSSDEVSDHQEVDYTASIDKNEHQHDHDPGPQLYCATNLPFGAPCRLLNDDNKDIINKHVVYGSLLNEPPYYYECQLGLSCIMGTCQATPTLMAERDVCRSDSDCFSSSLSAADGISNNNNNNRDMVCAMASFTAENKICCPQSFAISTTSNNNKNADYDLTLCRGQAQVGESCGTFHELCESGLCTDGQCQEAGSSTESSSSMTIGPIQMYDFGSCKRHEECQSRTCAFASTQHLGIGQEEPSPKVCCPRGKGTFDIVEDNGTAGGSATTVTFCRHAGSTGTVCHNQVYAQLCSSQLCMNGMCT